MKFGTISLLLLGFLLPALAFSQTTIDQAGNIPAEVYAYEITTAPTIDGDASDWANIPWSGVAYYNDRDFNGDTVPDPSPDKRDLQGRFKAAWIEGGSQLYLLLERTDDVVYSDELTSVYHVDGFEIRIDPYDENNAGEPGDVGDAYPFNIIFRVGNDELVKIEKSGAFEVPSYEAKWAVDKTVFPSVAVLELAITMPDLSGSDYSFTSELNLGFHIYFNDTEEDDDDAGSKSVAMQLWPQLFDLATGTKLGVDATWANTSSWGDLVCKPMPTTHEITGGGNDLIQGAVDAANPGDIIKVGPGTYYDNVVIAKSGISIVGSEGAVLVPADNASPAITISADDFTHKVSIKDLKIDGQIDENTFSNAGIQADAAETYVGGCYVTGFDAPLNLGAPNCVIEENTFYGNNGDMNIAQQNTLFRYNTVGEFNPGGYAVRALNMGDNEVIDIAYNTIFDARQCGIGYGGSANDGDNAIYLIHHNVVYRSFNERLSPTREMDDGIENQESFASTDYIFNNTVIGWDSDGFQMNGPSSFYMRNNIVCYNDGFAFDVRNTPGVLDIDYSLVFENGKGANDAAYADGVGSNMIDDEPAFADETTDDYSLTTDSPAVDAGEALPFGFRVFYAGTGPDMGAIESGVRATTTAVKDEINSGIVSSFELSQNYPNPFNPTTSIRFELQQAGNVSLKIFDVQGRVVNELVNGQQSAGNHTYTWDASTFTSGVYFYQLKAGNATVTKKMMLIK